MPRVQLPNGQIAEFPSGMPPDQIESIIQQQFPPSQPAAPRQYDPKQDPFAGGVSGYIGGNIKRNLPEIAATAAGGVPGPTMLAPPLAAAAATYAGEKAMGAPDPGMKALRAGAETLGGSLLGKAGQVTSQLVGKALDKTSQQVVKAIEKAIPEFAGKTPEETVNRIVGGHGMLAVMEDYGKTLRRIWNQEVGSVVPAGRLTEQFRDLMKQLSPNWSKAAQQELKDLDRKYAGAKSVEEWFSSMPVTKLAPEGGLSVQALQEAFVPRRASLAAAVPGIEKTLRMPAASLERDIPGQGLSIGGHIGQTGMPYAYLRHLPRAPQLAGKPTPEEVSMALRALAPSAFGEIAQQVMP